jgi:O-antigen/teichoic acid export membrane protein
MRRTAWVPLADQLLANASNFLFTILVAGEASPEAFGRFAVGYSVVVFAVGMWRSGLGYQVSLKAGDHLALAGEARMALGATAATSPFLALVVLVVAGVGPGSSVVLAAGLALATPFVLAQDLLRYTAVAANRAGVALASDSAWTGLLGVAVVLRMAGSLEAGSLILLWAGGAALGTAILAVGLRIAPRLAGAREWIGRSWRGRTHLVTQGVVVGASVPITTAVIALLAGPEVAGGVAGAGVLMAPVNSLVAWLSLTLLAGVAQLPEARKVRAAASAGVATALLTIGWGSLLLLVPDQLGEVVLGQTWQAASEALPVVGTQYAIGVLAGTGTLLLVSLGRTRAVMSTGFAVATARVALGWVAASTFATVFAAAVAETIAMMVWLGAVSMCVHAAIRHRATA